MERILEEFQDLKNEKMINHGELAGFTKVNEASRRSLNRVFNNLEKFSYVILSSDRHELLKEQNIKRFDKLKKIVKENGFSFIPVKGGFIEEKGNSAVYENSLIIFPVGRNRGIKSDEELFNFALELIQYDPIEQNEDGDFVGEDPTDVECFGQDSFLFKGKGQIAAYYGKDGEKQFEVGNDYIVNDKFQKYFTQLWKDHDKDNIGKFTFTEAYMTYEPRSVQGRHIRYLEGELVNYY
jgi:hypothetical protein